MKPVIVMAVMAAISAVMVWWIVCTQRKLLALEESIDVSMSRVGSQLSALYDALDALLHFVRAFAPRESERLMASVHALRCVITALSTPAEVRRQEGNIKKALEGVAELTLSHPEIGEDPRFRKTQKAIQAFDAMLCVSRAQYDDSVSRFNRAIRAFPRCLIAGILGFRARERLDEDQARPKAEIRAQHGMAGVTGQAKAMQRHRASA